MPTGTVGAPRSRAQDTVTGVPGQLALVGGDEWRPECTFDADLLEASGGDEVLLVPTAAAYEQPEQLIAAGVEHFTNLGAKPEVLRVMTRHDASNSDYAEAIRASRFVYFAGGSPMHFVSVLKASPVFDALAEAWNGGAVVAASDGAARAMCDPMVDPRGGAFTIGLGLVRNVGFVPHRDTWSEDRARRTRLLAPADLPLVAVDSASAIVRNGDGSWRLVGGGQAEVYVGNEPADLTVLP